MQMTMSDLQKRPDRRRNLNYNKLAKQYNYIVHMA